MLGKDRRKHAWDNISKPFCRLGMVSNVAQIVRSHMRIATHAQTGSSSAARATAHQIVMER